MNTQNEREKLHALFSALADSTDALSDEEWRQEIAETGVDVKATGSRVKSVLLDAILKGKKKRLADARKAHADAVVRMTEASRSLPSTSAEKRRLVERALSKRPQVRDAVLTVQHRDFESLSDEDLDGLLRQLQHLGLIDGDEDE